MLLPLAVARLLIYYAPLRPSAFADSFMLLHGRLPLRFSNCQGRLQVGNQLVYPVELFLYAERARCYVVAILSAMGARHWKRCGAHTYQEYTFTLSRQWLRKVREAS